MPPDIDYMHRVQIHVYGSGVPKPVTSFDEASFPSYVLSEIHAARFTEPSPIQAQARVCGYVVGWYRDTCLSDNRESQC